jgi:hypothetical protein
MKANVVPVALTVRVFSVFGADLRRCSRRTRQQMETMKTEEGI